MRKQPIADLDQSPRMKPCVTWALPPMSQELELPLRCGGVATKGSTQSALPSLQYLPMSVSVECINEELLALDDPANYRCCCGACHVVLATKLFLVFYVCITICGLIFGMMSAFVWTGIPILVTSMTVYAFMRQKHKYLYPFLIISVVQLIVCLVMALVVVTFAIVNYQTLRLIIGHSTQSDPTPYTVVCAVGATVGGCCLLAMIHVWQSVIIYGCLQYYEYVYRRDNHTTRISSATSPPCASIYENKHHMSQSDAGLRV
uniref:Transmembrane protein n=1 Tax=Panagrellus redivivus TaxID=6233 RepID=A0A7E4V4B5_PANRE